MCDEKQTRNSLNLSLVTYHLSLLLHFVTNGPEIGKDRFEE